MKIYKLSINFDYALADIVENYNDADSLSLTSETIDLLNDFRFDWNTDDSHLIPNIAIIMSKLLCFDIISWDEVRSLLPDNGITQISIGNKPFISLSNIPVLRGALNLKSSKLKYFSTGDIMEITSPVFNEREYPNLFKVEEIYGSFFCTDELKNTIVSNNLTGLKFEECRLKSKSWFRK